MDVAKSSSLDPAAAAAVAGSPTIGSATSGGAASGGLGGGSARSANAPVSSDVAAPSTADWVDIQPLDLAAALRILIAEVRAELALPAADLAPQAMLMPPSSTGQAAQVLLRMFLGALPDDTSNPRLWATAVAILELKFQSAIDRAIEVVAGWRGVPAAVSDAAAEVRELTVNLLRDSPPYFLWLQPEWLGVARRMERYWRRRRLASRGLTDPDSRSLREDWTDEEALRNEQPQAAGGADDVP